VLTRSGAQAAKLLEEACRPAPEIRRSARLELVRDLAEDLRLSLEALSCIPGGEASPYLLAEGALRCADLANLAACNNPELPEERKAEGAAAVHLAAGTARALGLLAESGTTALEETPAEYVRRDARSAGWRAALAIRQVEEFLETRRSG
jgi:hypothetical protein